MFSFKYTSVKSWQNHATGTRRQKPQP